MTLPGSVQPPAHCQTDYCDVPLEILLSAGRKNVQRVSTLQEEERKRRELERHHEDIFSRAKILACAKASSEHADSVVIFTKSQSTFTISRFYWLDERALISPYFLHTSGNPSRPLAFLNSSIGKAGPGSFLRSGAIQSWPVMSFSLYLAIRSETTLNTGANCSGG
jgi:hypothetical protein